MRSEYQNTPCWQSQNYLNRTLTKSQSNAKIRKEEKAIKKDMLCKQACIDNVGKNKIKIKQTNKNNSKQNKKSHNKKPTKIGIRKKKLKMLWIHTTDLFIFGYVSCRISQI